jgi:hypothetical protein
MHQHDPDTIDVIVGRDGREIDITFELREIVHIGRHFYPDSTPHPDDRRILDRLGWSLISVAGVETALDLVDEMLEDGESNPSFAAYLRTKWQAIANRMEEDSTGR